jgi:glycosyltransferase involved in cell wall biosynthesis
MPQVAQAEVALFTKGGRDFRMQRMMSGEEVPREFFYGYFELVNSGLATSFLSSAGRQPGAFGAVADVAERAFARATELGVRPLSARLSLKQAGSPKVIISFTDGFSLSLGLSRPRQAKLPIRIGGFHGLSDIEHRAPAPMKGLVRSLITRSLANLDHVFFFGPADRDFAIERYGVSPQRSSVYLFGVDTQFWRPLPDEPQEDFVVAIGQDRNRDYDLLAAAPGRHPTRIVTRQPVRIPNGAAHVKTTVGDYFGSDAMTDSDLRRLYNKAVAVIVPLKDVYQPSGYSVTLQAMSCGKPVILSDIKGLWTPGVLRNGENCLLVPPNDAAALGDAIARIRSDRELRERIGRAARETALEHYTLDRTANSTRALAELALGAVQVEH